MAGMRVLSGVPLEEAEDDCEGGVDCTEAGEELVVVDGKMVGGGVAEMIGIGPDTVAVVVDVLSVQMAWGRPSTVLNCVLKIKDVMIVV